MLIPKLSCEPLCALSLPPPPRTLSEPYSRPLLYLDVIKFKCCFFSVARVSVFLWVCESITEFLCRRPTSCMCWFRKCLFMEYISIMHCNGFVYSLQLFVHSFGGLEPWTKCVATMFFELFIQMDKMSCCAEDLWRGVSKWKWDGSIKEL